MSALPAPVLEALGATPTVELAVAVGLGVAFGWTLERAGLGSAPKLAGQFYGTDLSVFKVMFTALVTAMLGAFWLGRLGLLDLARVAVPETFWGAQLAGGLVFGLGFALAGLCPGTSCVAAASGRGDGVAVMLGLLGGVLATGFAFPVLAPLVTAGSRGPLTLPALFGVPHGVMAGVVTVVALAGFRLAEWVEARA